jgi:hypothetical protein
MRDDYIRHALSAELTLGRQYHSFVWMATIERAGCAIPEKEMLETT